MTNVSIFVYAHKNFRADILPTNLRYLLNSGKWDLGCGWTETSSFYLVIKVCTPHIIKKIVRKEKRSGRGRDRGEREPEKWKAIRNSEVTREATASKVHSAPTNLPSTSWLHYNPRCQLQAADIWQIQLCLSPK